MSEGRINRLSEEELDSIFRRFGVGDQEENRTIDGETGVKLISVSKLKPHPRNSEIYGKGNVSDLAVQIEAYGGIADPLKIKEDFTIISGHRRWQAARDLGMTEVPCQFVSYDSEEEELAALIMLNYHRTKTNEQKAREGMVLEQALKAEGMERKLRTLKQNQSDRAPGSPTVASAEMDDSSAGIDEKRKKGRTRDIVADAVSISSGRNFERMKKVIVAADKLKAEGKPDDSAFLLQMMDKSVKPAYNLLDAGYAFLPDEERARIRSGEIPVNQFVAEISKPKPSFKQIMKELSSIEQVLSNTAQVVDSLNKDEADELMNSLRAIKFTWETVITEVTKKHKIFLN